MKEPKMLLYHGYALATAKALQYLRIRQPPCDTIILPDNPELDQMTLLYPVRLLFEAPLPDVKDDKSRTPCPYVYQIYQEWMKENFPNLDGSLWGMNGMHVWTSAEQETKAQMVRDFVRFMGIPGAEYIEYDSPLLEWDGDGRMFAWTSAEHNDETKIPDPGTWTTWIKG